MFLSLPPLVFDIFLFYQRLCVANFIYSSALVISDWRDQSSTPCSLFTVHCSHAKVLFVCNKLQQCYGIYILVCSITGFSKLLLKGLHLIFIQGQRLGMTGNNSLLLSSFMSSASLSCYFSSFEHKQVSSNECMLLLNVFLICSKHWKARHL